MTPHDAMREIAEKAGYYTAVGGGTATGVAGWFNENWVSLGGFLIAATGLAVNWYYSHKRDQREERRLKQQHEKPQP